MDTSFGIVTFFASKFFTYFSVQCSKSISCDTCTKELIISSLKYFVLIWSHKSFYHVFTASKSYRCNNIRSVTCILFNTVNRYLILQLKKSKAWTSCVSFSKLWRIAFLACARSLSPHRNLLCLYFTFYCYLFQRSIII